MYIRPGPLYKEMQNDTLWDLITALPGYKPGSDGVTINAGISPTMDYDIGHYDPKTGSHVSNYFRNGMALSDRHKAYVLAHEDGHALGYDDVGCAMLGESKDLDLFLDVMGWRAAFALAGENNKDAEIYWGALERYSGTALESYLGIATELGKSLLKSGAYDNFRAYEMGLNRN